MSRDLTASCDWFHLPEHQLGQDPAGEGVEQADQQRGQGVVLGEPGAACTVHIAFNSGDDPFLAQDSSSICPNVVVACCCWLEVKL